MTYEEQEKIRKREKDICIFAHTIAEQVVAYEDITFSEAIQILDKARNIVERNMHKQRAAVAPEIRDKWGAIIGVSGQKPQT